MDGYSMNQRHEQLPEDRNLESCFNRYNSDEDSIAITENLKEIESSNSIPIPIKRTKPFKISKSVSENDLRESIEKSNNNQFCQNIVVASKEIVNERNQAAHKKFNNNNYYYSESEIYEKLKRNPEKYSVKNIVKDNNDNNNDQPFLPTAFSVAEYQEKMNKKKNREMILRIFVRIFKHSRSCNIKKKFPTKFYV